MSEPSVTFHYTNPDDARRVIIPTVLAPEDTPASVDIMVPALNPDVTHRIHELVVYGRSNSIRLHPTRASSIQRLTLGEGSQCNRAYGTSPHVTLRDTSRLTNVQLTDPHDLTLTHQSVLTNAQIHPESLAVRHDIINSTIAGRVMTPILIRHQHVIRDLKVYLTNITDLPCTAASVTLDDFDINLKLRNAEGEPIRIQQFSHNDECWVQMGCWLGSLTEARALVQGPASSWPSYGTARKKADIYKRPFNAIIDETRDRYRAVLDLIEANHKSQATGGY